MLYLWCMKYYLYTLAHPITNEIRYIGKTNNLVKRLWEHNNDKSKSHKKSWIVSLTNQGLTPIMEEIESFDNEEDCYSAESFWIIQFKAWGFNLTNLQEGGIGGSSKQLCCENNPRAKLTNQQVLQIKDLLLTTELSIKSIANRFGVGERLIYNITCGESWTSITGFTGKEKWIRGESVNTRAKALKDAGVYDSLSISVEQYDLEGNLLNIFKSIQEATKLTGVNRTSITQCINNKQKKTKQFIWKRSVK